MAKPIYFTDKPRPQSNGSRQPSTAAATAKVNTTPKASTTSFVNTMKISTDLARVRKG